MLPIEVLSRGSSLQERTRAGLSEQAEMPSSSKTNRLRNWQDTTNLDGVLFDRRLELIGLTRASLEKASTINLSQAQLLQLPWAQTLATIFAINPSVNEPQVVPNPSWFVVPSTPTFWRVFWPFMDWAHTKLGSFIDGITIDIDKEQFTSCAIRSLRFRLLETATRALVIDLQRTKRDGHLKGNNPYERYDDYVERYLSNSGIRIWNEYPVLARLLATITEQWLNSVTELLGRITNDKLKVQTLLFNGGELGKLMQAEGMLSDPHRGGRTVWCLTFISGFKLIYKPRSLAIEQHFQELLAWLNDRGATPEFKVMKLLNCGDYGWVEFLEKRPCHTDEQVKRFYQRIGAYLALLYLLNGSDFHHGNIIAVDEHPVLLDMEGLFQNPGIQPYALRIAGHSVLSTGILPVWLDKADISALGSYPGQKLSTTIPLWVAPYTDEMHLEREHPTSLVDQHLPSLGQQLLNAHNYSEEIERGLRTIYALLQANRNELSSLDGPILRFASDEARYVARGTRVYSLILWGSHHPNSLRDGLAHDRSLDRLCISATQLPYLWKLIPSEHEDMWQEDIPIFVTRPISRDIWDSRGKQIYGFFAESSLDIVVARLQNLSTDDCDRQAAYIQASLATIDRGDLRRQRLPSIPSQPSDLASDQELLDAALCIGEKIEKMCIGDKCRASWIGFVRLAEDKWVLAPVPPSLYDGNSGIALFLAYLAKTSGEERFQDLAHRTLVTILGSVADEELGIGAFSGLAGVLYCWMHLKTLWNEPIDSSEIGPVLERLDAIISKDDNFDIMDGVAGCMLVLLRFYDMTGHERAKQLAVSCGNHLLRNMVLTPSGRAWRTSASALPLTGFGHGAAGISYALFELARTTNESRFREGANSGLEYERKCYSPEHRNWLDLRHLREDTKGTHHFISAWCNGATGIGLGRLLTLEHNDDAVIREEISIALETTLRDGFGYDHSLCHGDMGSIETLLLAAERLNESKWFSIARRCSKDIIKQSLGKEALRCGLPIGVCTNGLMVGLSGIGFGFLRCLRPRIIPSVLALHPPLRYKPPTQ